MPDDNITCRTKAEALACASDKAQELRSEGIRVHGRKSDGYYDVASRDVGKAGLEYIEVTTCTEATCLLDLED